MTASTVVTRPMLALAALSIGLSGCSGTSAADLASASRSAAQAQAQKDTAAQQATTQASLKADIAKLKAAASRSASASRSSSASSASSVSSSSASSSSTQPTPSPSQSVATRTTRTTSAVAPYVDPVAVVQKYYSDLNNKDFRAAWNAGGYNFTNGGNYSSWVAGYSDTTGVIGTATDIGGGKVSTQFSAVHVNGSVVRYAGSYTVRGTKIVSGHMHRVR